MTQYYNGKRSKHIFDPKSNAPFKLSRSKIDLFLNCPRCFYLDRRLGIGQPPGFPFSLNTAVDTLLKKEFDSYRKLKLPHPLMRASGIDAVPFVHRDLEEWRNNFKGVTYLHRSSNLILTGAIDDVWVNPKGKLMVVDYKSTSKKEEVNLDAPWQISYKRQMEFYQWLLRMNGFDVLPTGYFVYCNGITEKESFDQKLEFEIKIIPYEGNSDWVEAAVLDARECLSADTVPEAQAGCDYCTYTGLVTQAIQ